MKTKLTVCVLLLSAALWAVGCGIGNAVRPSDPTAGQATGEAFVCTPEKLAGNLSPFTVDWSDGDRVALESEMQSGVALLKLTCEGVEVLRGCDVPGDYGYKGISKKTKLVSMSDMGSVKANIGGTVNLPSEFKAEMSQGSSLDLAYVLVGAQNTTVRNVSKSKLKEHCQGATHFVYEAQLGAFAMQTSAKGEVSAAADVLGFGKVSGEAASQKKVRVTDGEPQACDNSSAKDREATEGCQALMRVSIIPLTAEASQTSAAATKSETGTDLSTVDVRGCPEGFVYDDGQCKYASQATAYLCDEGDLKNCRAQCEAGSVESCGRFSSAYMDDTMSTNPYVTEKMIPRFFSEVVPLEAKLKEACDSLEASACTLSALLLDKEAIKNENDPDKKYIQAYVDLIDMACMFGDQRACQTVADTYGDGGFSGAGIPANPELLDFVLGGACEGGNARACWLIGELYYFSAGVKPDINKSASYLTRACYADNTMACAFAGLMYNYNDTAKCAVKLKEILPHLTTKNFILQSTADAEEIAEFCQATAGVYDDSKAFDAFISACDDADQDFGLLLCSSAELNINLDDVNLDDL
jgi:hypothetical protein